MANDCLEVIDAAAKGRLSDDEIEQIVEALEDVRRSRSASEDLAGLERRMFDRAEQIVEDIDLAAAVEKRNRLRNIIAESRLMAEARAAAEQLDDPSLGLEAAMVGVNAPLENARDSVDARGHAYQREYLGGIAAELKQEGLLGAWTSGTLDRQVSRELWDLSLEAPTGAATTSKQAKGIARILHKYKRLAVERENRAGAYIRYRQGHVVRQSHRPDRIERAGFEKWAAEVSPRLDWTAMEIPVEERGRFLKSAYEALVSGKRKEQAAGDENDLLFAFKGPGNLAKRESAHRVLVFRSADDWFDYDQQFGQRSLREAMQSDLSRAARNTALMERFGTNPRAMFDKVRDRLEKDYRGEKSKRQRLQSLRLDWQFAEIDGSVNAIHSPSLASWSAGIRAVQSMAKLGGAVISAFADVAAVASERRYQGRTLLGSWTDALTAPMGAMGNAEARHYADLVGIGIDTMLGDAVSRFSAQDDLPGRMSKLQATFFKLNFLGPWTDAVKRGAGMMLARDLAVNANKRFDALDPKMQRLLGMYGFDARKWEVARGAIVDVGGRKAMLPGEVGNVRGAVFSGLSEPQQERLRDEVAAALRTLLVDRADFASPTPGARERALMRFGLARGTALGEAARFFMQFKAFPITVTTKVLGRDLYGGGARTMSDAILRGQGELVGLASYIAGASVLGYVSMQAKELAKGRSPREDHYPAFLAGALQGGGLGIYGDFLLGETNRFGRSMLDTLAGPTLGTMADLDTIRAKVMAGEDVWASVVNVARSNTPYVNLFYTKTALDYLIVYQMQEWASPGYLRRMERRMAREQGQQFMIPPSSTIPRGGGDRVFEGVR